MIALGLGFGLAPRFDSAKSFPRENTALSAESFAEYGPNKTMSMRSSSTPLLVSILPRPDNGASPFGIPDDGVVREVAQESIGVRFADFKVVVEFEEEDIDVEGTFTLGAASNGIDLFKEKTTMTVGSFSATIPAGSFEQGSKGKAEFQKLIECKYWVLFIRALGKGTFEIDLELQGTKGAAKIKPEEVTLTIGDDGGTAKPAS